MANKKSKTDIIATFIAENPDATWKDAEPTLKAKGISPAYYATQRSKLKSGTGTKSKPGRKPGCKSTARSKGGRASSDHALTSAADFARSVGGLDKARALLDELANVQI